MRPFTASFSGVLLTLFASVLPSSVLASPLAVGKPTTQLLVTDTELTVQYGKYAEATIALPGSENRVVEWSILGSSVPPGLKVYDSGSSNLVLYGTPTFSGTWCTVYVAKVDASSDANALQGMQEICFNARANADIEYPKFANERRYIGPKMAGESIAKTFTVIDATFVTGTLLEQSFPADSIAVSYSHKKFRLRGRIATEGSYAFALKAIDANGVANSHQYVLQIQNPQEVPVCAAGYYFDADLGYCVSATNNQCPAGTYYEASANQCIQYPAPPPTVVCAAGYYFDPFLSTCVPSYAERCPLNYAYDNYEERCVRQPYTCNYGERYDYFVKDCVGVYAQTCSYDEHYDAYADRCVRDYDACMPGFYYSPSYGRCVASVSRCAFDEVYDPRYGGCRNVQPSNSCPYGTSYNWSLGRCTSVYVNLPVYCASNERYDPLAQRCIGYHSNPAPIPGGRPIPVPGTAYCPSGTAYNPSIGRCTSVLGQPQRPVPPRPIPAPGGASCPPGTIYRNNRCVSTSVQPPAPRPMPPAPRPMPPAPRGPSPSPEPSRPAPPAPSRPMPPMPRPGAPR